jgi:hypothetical protein
MEINLDLIIEKIRNSGINSLTKEEIDFLFDYKNI